MPVISRLSKPSFGAMIWTLHNVMPIPAHFCFMLMPGSPSTLRPFFPR